AGHQPRHVRRRAQERGSAAMVRRLDVRAQVSMVFHLDKCIGCHTCSLACKNLWTDRPGAEYMWWNNVETKPGTGYPTRVGRPEHVEGRLGEQRLAETEIAGPPRRNPETVLQRQSARPRRLLRAVDLSIF